MYIVQERKNGIEYEMQTDKCKYCLGNEFVMRDKKIYCANSLCGKEYKENE